MVLKFDPRIHHRRSIRIKGYDYSSAGAYFVTMCIKDRECILHDPIVSGIISDVWDALPKWFPTIALDEFVVMPNHLHFIVWLQSVRATLAVAQSDANAQSRAGASPAPTDRAWIIPEPESINRKPTLGDVVGAFKSLVFTVYVDWVDKHDPKRHAKFWQRNYYEHIVRNESDLNAICQYIRDNPVKWELDRDNPNNIKRLSPPTHVEDYLQDIGIPS